MRGWIGNLVGRNRRDEGSCIGRREDGESDIRRRFPRFMQTSFKYDSIEELDDDTDELTKNERRTTRERRIVNETDIPTEDEPESQHTHKQSVSRLPQHRRPKETSTTPQQRVETKHLQGRGRETPYPHQPQSQIFWLLIQVRSDRKWSVSGLSTAFRNFWIFWMGAFFQVHHSFVHSLLLFSFTHSLSVSLVYFPFIRYLELLLLLLFFSTLSFLSNNFFSSLSSCC